MQFDVYRNGGPNAEEIAFLLDVQADLLAHLATRIVIPLVRGPSAVESRRLNPTVFVDGETVLLSTQELGAIPARELAGPPVANLGDQRYKIIDAIDVLISGI